MNPASLVLDMGNLCSYETAVDASASSGILIWGWHHINMQGCKTLDVLFLVLFLESQS